MSGFWQAPQASRNRRLLSGVLVGLAFATLAMLGFTSGGSLAANGYGYGYGYGCPGYGYGYCPPPQPQPTALTLAPATDTNTVDDQHCVTATVRDQFGNPMPNVTVRFSVTGSVTTSGSSTTNAAGQAEFCYTGPALPGADVITAYADTDKDNVTDPPPADPEDTAAKAWVIPASTPGCKVTYGGRITAANGDTATFGGTAKANGPAGEEEYQDLGPATNLNVHSIDVDAVVCRSDGTASIFGTATINGSGMFDYRIDLKDAGEPGESDTYRIRLSNGYDSGEQVIVGGNVQIH
jgi:hypothetical protein